MVRLENSTSFSASSFRYWGNGKKAVEFLPHNHLHLLENGYDVGQLRNLSFTNSFARMSINWDVGSP